MLLGPACGTPIRPPIAFLLISRESPLQPAPKSATVFLLSIPRSFPLHAPSIRHFVSFFSFIAIFLLHCSSLVHSNCAFWHLDAPLQPNILCRLTLFLGLRLVPKIHSCLLFFGRRFNSIVQIAANLLPALFLPASKLELSDTFATLT